MKDDLVVKDNVLINASYNLEVTEQRLILLAIITAREIKQGIKSDSKLEIFAQDYAQKFNVSNDAAYKALKSAVINLFERQFSFKEIEKNGEIGTVKSRWVSRIKYLDDSGILQITFAPDVIPFITRLEEQFTSYKLKQVAQLKSKYAIRLYEILIAWKEVKKTPRIAIEDLRNSLGVENSEYLRMSDFKIRVLDSAVKQINKFTDVSVTYEQFKRGKEIIAFQFQFKIKENIENLKPTFTDSFFKMTEAQLNMFSSKLAELPEVGSKIAKIGEDPKAFMARLRMMLMDEVQQKKLRPYLKQLGFEVK